ncbi:MAG TPA: hypothetical protein VE218_11340 [Acidobacteriaceae bacterium]|nr:hypothetical protein [Acidobacteriaceae bacterium]
MAPALVAMALSAILTAMLTAICATAQTPPAGAAPETGSAQQKIGPQGTLQTPAAPETKNPETNKLAPENGGLTFLPELKPTDGVVNLVQGNTGDAQIAAAASAMHEKPMLLDRAVAVINGDVILASDVREQQRFAVFEPLSAPNGEFTPLEAMQQIVNRTLLLDQMEEQQLTPPPTDGEVDAQVAYLRQHLPACAGQACETEAGWQRLLAAHGFTVADLHARWKERMEILDFVGVRFRTGIRITKPEIESYYKEKLVPEFQTRKLTPPPLAQVSDRIDEVLLQQHVNVLLNDYLRSLKDSGSVQILDPQYNSVGSAPSSGSATGAGGADFTRPSHNGGEQ